MDQYQYVQQTSPSTYHPSERSILRSSGFQPTPESTPTMLSSAGDPSYRLSISQQPKHGRLHTGKEKDRKPIDPPPIVRLEVSPSRDPSGVYLSNPYDFITCHLIDVGETDERNDIIEKPVEGNKLAGTIVSSLHRLKDSDNQDVAYFVFSDVAVKMEGKFRLQFTLYEMGTEDCTQLASIKSDVFQVFPAKSYPGMEQSTFLTRAISDQGVRVRIRKDSRQSQNLKRNRQLADVGTHVRAQRRKLTEGDAYVVGSRPVASIPETSGTASSSPQLHSSSHTSLAPGSGVSSRLSAVHSQFNVGAGLSGHSGYLNHNLGQQSHLLHSAGLPNGQLTPSPSPVSTVSPQSMALFSSNVTSHGYQLSHETPYHAVGAQGAPNFQQPPA